MLTSKERELLSGRNFLHIATVNPDGSPQVSVVWVEAVDDIILINTVVGRVKERNMARDPRVAMSIYDQDDPYDEIAIRGKVVGMSQDGARAHIDALSQKYLGRPYPWHYDADNRIIIKINKVTQ